MLYVKLAQDGTTIEMIHHMPFDKEYGLGKSKEELEAEGGIFVDSVQEPENRPGKSAVLKYSGANGLYYEYIDREMTQEEKMIELQQKYDLMQSALDELIFGGML